MKKFFAFLLAAGVAVTLMGADPVTPGTICVPSKVIRAFGRTANGQEVPWGTPGAASVQVYEGDFSLTVPPEGVIPANIPDAQRQNLGLSSAHMPEDVRPLHSDQANIDPMQSQTCSKTGVTNLKNQDSPIWAGRELKSAVGSPPFIDVYMNFTVPDYQTYCSSSSDSTTWVGLDSGLPLLQDGFGTSSSAPQNTGVEGWWEDYPNRDQQPDTTLVVHEGDSVFTQTHWDGGANWQATFTLRNNTTGVQHDWTVWNLVNEWASGAIAVWITERPTHNGNYQLLRKTAAPIQANTLRANFYDVNHFSLDDTTIDRMHTESPALNQTEMTTVTGTTTQSWTWADCGPNSGLKQ